MKLINCSSFFKFLVVFSIMELIPVLFSPFFTPSRNTFSPSPIMASTTITIKTRVKSPISPIHLSRVL